MFRQRLVLVKTYKYIFPLFRVVLLEIKIQERLLKLARTKYLLRATKYPLVRIELHGFFNSLKQMLNTREHYHLLYFHFLSFNKTRVTYCFTLFVLIFFYLWGFSWLRRIEWRNRQWFHFLLNQHLAQRYQHIVRY